MKSKVLFVLVLGLLTTGCVRVDVGDRKPTLGEEIRDLDRARDDGLITDEQFAKGREMLFDALIR